MSLPRFCRATVPLLAAALASAGCSHGSEGLADEPVAKQSAPIINGKLCSEAINGSAVALILEAKMNMGGFEMPMRTVMCTGTLIAPDVVLTAAHCVTPSMLTNGMGTISEVQYHVSFEPQLATYADQRRGLPPQLGGKPLAPLPEGAHKVASFLAHPDFDPADLSTFRGGVNDNLNDIGLMFLDKAIPMEEKRPALLITKEEAKKYIVTNTEVRIAGWGQRVVTPNPLTPPPAGSVGVKYCAGSFINEIGAHEMQIGDGPETSRKCHGDSGGPSYIDIPKADATTYLRERLVGITSHAYDQTDCAKGGVDTRVDVWLDWIEAELQKGCADNSRRWCDVTGIIPPDFHKAPPAPDQGAPSQDAGAPPAGDGESGSDGSSGGCTVSSATDASSLPWALLLVALVALRRRRR